MTGPIYSFYDSFPELKPLRNKIHILFASTHKDHAFLSRPTKDILREARDAFAQQKRIVFYNSSETFIPQLVHKVQRVAELLHEIPREFLFFSVGCPDGQKFYDALCEKHKWPNKLNILSSHMFEYSIKTFYRGAEWYLGDESYKYEVKRKDKLFVCFNKLHRKHRLQLLAESIRNGWIHKSYYSFEGTDNWINKMKFHPISEQDKETILSVKNIFPLRLNITEDRINPVNLDPSDLIYHSNSYFSIVMETIMGPYDPKDYLLEYMNTLFLSEKIYKPFAFKHPFIAFAWPGTLKFLRERGYKTFHPFINESYDDEPDYTKRFKMLIEEIKRLEKFTDDQWLEWQENIKPIVEHNAKYLRELEEHRCGPPVDHLFR